MGRPFQSHREAAVDADVQQVWEAIATGPGIDSWFMGSTEVEPGATVRTAFGDYTPQHIITAWEPGRRLAYRDGDPGTGRFVAYEFLLAARGGGGTVLRTVTSGFLPGDDWADEYEAMGHGLDLFFATLVTYLTRFRGRTARPITAFGPPVGDWPRTWAALHTALALPGPATTGDPVRLSPPGADPVTGVVYHASAQTLAVRTPTAMYRFIQGLHGPLVASHHDFDPHPSTGPAWQGWLADLIQE